MKSLCGDKKFSRQQVQRCKQAAITTLLRGRLQQLVDGVVCERRALQACQRNNQLLCHELQVS